MKKIIISGFGPFGDYPENVTRVVARRLHGKNFCGFKVEEGIIFPSVISEANRGQMLLERAFQTGAVAIISLGMASGARGFRVENVGRNRVFNERYCPACLNNKPVDVTRRYGEDRWTDLAPWNIEVFFAACQAEGIPVGGISEDAGGFCCNQLIYQLLVWQFRSREYAQIPFIFLHVSCSKECVSDLRAFEKTRKITMTEEETTRALTLLLEGSSIGIANAIKVDPPRRKRKMFHKYACHALASGQTGRL